MTTAILRYNSRAEAAARHYQNAVRNIDGIASAELRLFAILDETELGA
jgi:hypothetical protein